MDPLLVRTATLALCLVFATGAASMLAAPARFAEEAESDLRLIRSFMARLDEKRAVGNGRLTGKKDVGEFAPGDSFLDGHATTLPFSAIYTDQLTNSLNPDVSH